MYFCNDEMVTLLVMVDDRIRFCTKHLQEAIEKDWPESAAWWTEERRRAVVIRTKLRRLRNVD
jgi:hypothetical protein